MVVTMVRLQLSPAFWTLNQTFELVFEFDFSIIFSYFRKVWDRTNSKFSVSLECLETPVFYPQTLKNMDFDPKIGFFDTKTGNYFQTNFQTIFAKFLRVRKTLIFLKNFRTKLYRNLQKQKVWKFPSNAEP